MSVQAVYYSDRDGLEMALKRPDELLFNTKAEADARDKVLELSEEIREYLLRKVEGMSDELADKCALVIAEDKELFQKAFKKPQVLSEAGE
ncbi:YebG family protein [Allohahella sp. A8]|uniref:YebG family protein n=1 Tax=Allohahella sp. A8 TaxID=3141461 RepID=UPI000C0AE5A8|nr:hypothetical protein [Hahellaceae bacterium]|tara:strand:+ start:17971 stop:18243 length:273 start_codon:yes stop_codon:yes gene_type:complete